MDRLHSTCTVVGLFSDWECQASEACLLPGDALVLYTDGVTEACNQHGEEFGEERLAETLLAHRHLCAKKLLSAVVDEVQRFSPEEQQDDITLIVARCLETEQQSLFRPSA